jgi:CubicO group peptidase (beta-lactamase class C family)
MRANLWFRLILCLCLLSAMGQTLRSNTADRRKAVEENLRHETVIKGQPDPGMLLIEEMSRLHVPGVSIAVVHDMKVEWAKGYGVARLGGPPVTPSTLFGAASMSKPLTAMAVLRLAQEGKIDLDTDVNVYLKSWKLPANEFTRSHPVTIRELLNHTSGIGTHSGGIYDPDKGLPSTLQMLDGKAPSTTAPVRVEAEPGSKYAYANGGYLILQLLITDLTGETFAKAMQEMVLAPLRMTQSTFAAPLPPDRAKDAATAYGDDGKTGTAPTHFVEPNAAAGGLWTTAVDYARFVIELEKECAGQSQLILDQKMARMMVTQGMGPSDDMRWGLGVRVGGTQPHLYFEHGGSAVFQDDMVGYLSGDGVVVLTNGGGGGRLTDEIVRGVAQVYGWPDFRPVEHTVVSVDPSRFAGLTGTYDFIRVTQDGNHLMAEIPLGTKEQELLPESNTQYFLRDGPTRILFDLDSHGRATGVEFITSMVHWHRDRNP